MCNTYQGRQIRTVAGTDFLSRLPTVVIRELHNGTYQNESSLNMKLHTDMIDSTKKLEEIPIVDSVPNS